MSWCVLARFLTPLDLVFIFIPSENPCGCYFGEQQHQGSDQKSAADVHSLHGQAAGEAEAVRCSAGWEQAAENEGKYRSMDLLLTVSSSCLLLLSLLPSSALPFWFLHSLLCWVLAPFCGQPRGIWPDGTEGFCVQSCQCRLGAPPYTPQASCLDPSGLSCRDLIMALPLCTERALGMPAGLGLEKLQCWGLPQWSSGQKSACQMHGTRVWSLVWKDPTCHEATKPVHRNYWVLALEPVLHSKRIHCSEKPEHQNKE